MKDKNLQMQFPYKIISLKTNSFSEVNLSDEEIEKFNADKIEFGITTNFGFNEASHLVKVNLIIIYTYQDQELLKIDVDTVFKYAVAKDFEIKNKNFLSQILGISFSTVRGIILNRTVGSFLNNIYLPIINPSEIIGDQIH